ncbi:Myo-inositol-monophosphatase [Aureimonas endophytica]|uniref:Myo-inositol-monophosphatase n=1 Tax=Aureimonas endophytica TaxID=2027858 RepID=A0A916ZTR4_9HYPH|nr:inositol monophosphatase family protein [Aureimonas endophytica]GGE12288.1 Myo-inositol-monophosphatase [Aureimonas endophytica]
MSREDLLARRAAAEAVVAEAASLALDFFARRGALGIDAKRPRDFVPEADRAVERRVRALIAERFPGESVVGEEEGGEAAERYWIVDPIDGTSNFIAGAPLWGVSLGYVVADEPVVGAVRAPVLGEALAGARGCGLARDGVPLETGARPPSLGLVSLGDSADDHLPAMIDLYARLRRGGWFVQSYHCTSVAMLFAALGRLDGHIQPQTTMWDMAGGVVLCREAGLTVATRRFETGAYGVWAGTPAVLDVARPD